jgi:hypothetical protein
LVKAGEATLDAATGQLISFTNSGFDQTLAQIICPALGGSPAWWRMRAYRSASSTLPSWRQNADRLARPPGPAS